MNKRIENQVAELRSELIACENALYDCRYNEDIAYEKAMQIEKIILTDKLSRYESQSN